ncbi:MAG: hypothetical protein HYR85_07540 [Planctomycetes bacterium]|nr:hypothetical protein [Planctomycetota bacterium]MBI3848060.1 hypothetical protein [Planctomycetota bacterium]
MKQLLATAVGAVALVGVGSVLHADNGPSHQVFQTRPIALGTTGGNINDISRAFCCGGTLGSLVQNSSGTQFILSNNHVLALSNNGQVGQDVIQPGLIDQSPVCAQDVNDRVADLSAFITIVKSRSANNQADAAVAQVVSGAVRTDGSILDVGCLHGSRTAAVGMAVAKSGRTSGLTTGTVAAVDSTILVSYPDSCGGGGGKAARFINQIRVDTGSFIQSGDSGSLVVENIADGVTDAVGLAFAGSSSTSFANPIAPVLSSMPGGPYTMVTGTCTSAFTSTPASSGDEWDPALVDAMVSRANLEGYLRSMHREIPTVIGLGVGASSSASNPYALEIYVDQNDPRFSDDITRLPMEFDRMEVIVIPMERPVAF